MTKKSIAELVALQSRRLAERLMPRHRDPAAFPGLGCTAASRLVLAVLLATVSSAVGCGKTNAAPATPGPEVEVASVVQQDVPIVSEWVATLDGFVNADSASGDGIHHSPMRYTGGVTGYLEVLTNETNAFAAELALVQARQNELLALVQLYEALGGGWQQ